MEMRRNGLAMAGGLGQREVIGYLSLPLPLSSDCKSMWPNFNKLYL